ncbi:MAG: hypothetical protein QG611_551, partial [Bacteroidota bacterium]|nr:hypothetical protein [Bacteroidota bacterium]
MDKKTIIEEFKEKFRNEVLGEAVKNEKRVIITIKPESILNVADYLYKTAGFRFIIASALHTKKGFEIHYHFSKDDTGLILNIHVILDNEKIQIES